MASKLSKLISHIEDTREELNELSKGKELSDPDVIAASQKLDAVLNEYYSIIMNKE